MSGQTSLPIDALENEVAQLIVGASPERFDAALRSIAATFAAATGTLHRADVSSQTLHLVAQLGLPEALIPITRQIPFGKGIAGQCAVELQPITLCNLQTDDSGKARPNAKQTGVAGAIAVPVFGPAGELVGVLGVGKIQEHTYTEDEQRVLAACAAHLGRALTRSQD
jgi:signal transduction protein with GAF and PtsI domain